MVTVEKAGSGVVCTNLPADLFSTFWLIWCPVTFGKRWDTENGYKACDIVEKF